MTLLFNRFFKLSPTILVAVLLFTGFFPSAGKNTSVVDHYLYAATPFPDEETYHAEPLGDFTSITIPLKRAGRLLLIEATVDGQTGNFVFDTGATGLVLNRTYFREYHAINQESANGITGQVGLVERIKTDRIDIGDLYYLNQTADMADLGHIENQRGVKILGLFGFDMIKRFEIEIDIQNNQLHLSRIDKKGIRPGQSDHHFKADCVLPIIGRRDVVMIKGEVGGEELCFCLDTGAESNAISAQASNKVLQEVNITRRSTLRGAGSSRKEVLFGSLNKLTVGHKQLINLDVLITPLNHLSEAYGARIDGMLGFSFLETCTVCINLRKKEVAFRFNSTDEK